jgi:peptidoglycan hydrolase-like protein with peptidoglycan-binding domain
MPTEAQVAAYHARQIGTLEVPRGSNRTVYNKWYGMSPAAWCDIYQSWIFAHVGGASIVGKFAWTVAHAKWFKARGQWGTTPRPGALVFYDWSGGKSLDGIDHVGFVERVLRDGRLQTIEGNSNIGGPDGVWRHYRSQSLVVGYGYPKYDSGTVTSGSRVPPIGAHAKPKKLTVDGVMGPLTIKALQRALKVAADGELGPITKKALQKALVVPQTGHVDINTKRALRMDLGLASASTWTAAVTKALQKALNAGKFPAPMVKHRITTGKEKTSWAAVAAALGIGLASLLAANPGNTMHTPVKPHTTVVVPAKPTPKPAPKPAPKPGKHRAVTFPGYAAVDFGSHNGHVKTLQSALRKAGAAPGAVDGQYGPRTRAAVKRYQKKHHLHVDGVVGPRTWKALFA